MTNPETKRPRGRPKKDPGSPRTTARRLNIPGTLDHAFFQAGGREVAIAMARLAARKDESIEELLVLWDDLSQYEKQQPLLLEQLCHAVGLHPSDFLGKITAAAYKHNFDVASYIAAVNAPEIVSARAQMAKQPEGLKDAELVLKHTGFIEPEGPSVQITNQQLNVTKGLPQFSETVDQVTSIARQGPNTQQLGPAPQKLEPIEAEYSMVEASSD